MPASTPSSASAARAGPRRSPSPSTCPPPRAARRPCGWGRPFPAFFDPARVNVINRARGGRSSRTFLTEGLWDRLLDDVKPGDFVLIEFGHNDGGAINDERRARGSLPGLGDETQDI